jgi:hypothetical protein
VFLLAFGSHGRLYGVAPNIGYQVGAIVENGLPEFHVSGADTGRSPKAQDTLRLVKECRLLLCQQLKIRLVADGIRISSVYRHLLYPC